MRCGHATGEMRDYVERAIDIGLAEIGFSDHMPLLHTFDSTLTMSWDELPFYIADVKKLKEEYRRIEIKLGIEVDYVKGREAELKSLIDDFDFDYVLGSVHFLEGWGIDDRRYIDNYQNYDILDLYKRYFSLVDEAARSGLFDIIAHPDLIKKYGFRPESDISEIYEETAKSIAEADVAIEISSAGLRKPVKEIYPTQNFIDICFRRGVPIVVGSDAHHPNDVGRDFNFLLESAAKAGYDKIASYTKRKRSFLAIGGDESGEN